MLKTIDPLSDPRQYNPAASSAQRIAFADSLPRGPQNPERLAPRNANTIDAALCTGHLADALISVGKVRLAPLRAFSRDFGTDPIKPRATVYVRKASSSGSVQSNPTNFETGDTSLDDIAVTVNQVSKSWHISSNELQSGSALKHMAEVNCDVFCRGVSDVITALMIAGNFGAATVIGAAADFSGSDLAPTLAAAKNYRQKNLLLDGGHLAYLLPTDKASFRLGEAGAYGFDLIAEQNRWTGATANACGFACSPDAIAVASGLPAGMPAEEFLSLERVTLPGIGLTVQAAVWFARASRTHWASLDVLFGAAVGDASQAEVLVTA